MKTLLCRNLAIDCLDSLTASDAKEMQKVFLAHAHAKHPQQWGRFSQQFKSVAIVSMRDRFTTQAEEPKLAA
jgi:hypothetical protein